jgi:hypothetical protein
MKTSKMKTSINLKTRKMKNNYLKLGMMAAVMLSASIGFAQTTTGDITVGANAGLGTSGTTVKVIDNKGTVKYLQSNNGITTFTNDTPSGGVVTTWQLGGTLTSATNIATGANEFKITLDRTAETAAGANDATQGTFIIDGVELESGAASTNATDGSSGTGTGYTFLVRDEATGKTKKLLASTLITGIRTDNTVGTFADTAFTITVSELPIIDTTNDFKLSVYRNGVKLRFGTDFNSLSPGGGLSILANTTDRTMYAGDIIEIQYLN